MKPNAVTWFEIYVQDMARARKFYEAVLDVKLERLGDAGIEMWFFPADPEGRRPSSPSGNTASSPWCTTPRAR